MGSWPDRSRWRTERNHRRSERAAFGPPLLFSLRGPRTSAYCGGAGAGAGAGAASGLGAASGAMWWWW
jgi:hypothetical protein